MKPVCCIIVTYKGSSWISACLERVLLSTIPVQIIVIDNSSTDDTLKVASKYVPIDCIITLDQNIGFGKANNIGIREAIKQGFEYIALINQDLYVEPDTLELLMACHLKHPEFGIISPLQYNGSGSGLDQNFENVMRSATTYHSDLQMKRLKQAYTVHFAMAAVWLLPVATIGRVGLFTPFFEHYGEDNDFCNRVLYHGMQIGVEPAAKAYHDREFRKRAPVNQLKVQFAQVLAHTLNINKPPLAAIGKMFYNHTRFVAKALLQLNFLLLTTAVAGSFSQISKLPVMMKIRTRNKIVSSHVNTSSNETTLAQGS